MSSDIDFGAIMPDVAKALWGEPNAAKSRKGEWRWGRNGARSVDIEHGRWFDHETKEGGGVLDLLKREKGFANGEAIGWLRDQGIDVGEKPAKRKIVATYDYVDEDGKLIFQVCRYEPKDFRQRRPDPDRPGDWIWSIKGIKPVPFRLPELLKAVALKKPIFIVEGEKDVLTLDEHGLIATCNAGGAGKWSAGFAEYFAQADVVIIPDNDKPGKEHAEDIARSLIGKAARIRVLALPGLADKEDITDWLRKNGGTIEAFDELVATAPEWKPAEEKHASGLIPLTIKEWLARDLPEADNLLGEVFATHIRILAPGPTGVGKTLFYMSIALALSEGRDFLHWRSHRPARVLNVEGEISQRLLKRRLGDAVRRAGGCQPDGFHLLSLQDLDDPQPLNTPEGQAQIEHFIDARMGGECDFIFFDSCMALLDGVLKDEEPWLLTLPWARKLTKLNIGQCWLHHTGHDENRSYGTKIREWQMDSVMFLEKVKAIPPDLVFKLRFDKARERSPENMADFDQVSIHLRDDQWTVNRLTGTAAAEQGRKKDNASPKAREFLKALIKTLASDAGIRRGDRRVVHQDPWKAECIRLKIIDPAKTKKQQDALFYKYRRELVIGNLIACEGEYAWPI